MKRIIFIFCILEYVLCRSVETELQAISPDEISLLVYTQADPSGTEIHLTDANQVTEISPFKTNLKTVIYVHGWHDTVQKESCKVVREALLKSENVNVITVNWDSCAKSIDYLVSKRCVPDVGKYVGEFLETMTQTYSYSLSDITVVGHSLGAHIAGHIGKNTNGNLGIIVGLDPAGPMYFKDSDDRLTENDAQYVQAIHTNAILLGVNYNLGNSDFWPNGGYSQKGCGIDTKCSHLNAWRYYSESLTNNAFFARQCDSYDDFEDRECNQNAKTKMGGVNIDTAVYGEFYLDTNPKSPYALGDVV